MTRYQYREVLRYVLLAIVFIVFAALSFIMIIALLTDWPKMLHRSDRRDVLSEKLPDKQWFGHGQRPFFGS